MEERVITSLNTISWLKSHSIEVKEKNDNGFYYVVVKDTDEVQELMKQFKQNEELQNFIREFKNIKLRMRGIRQ